MKRIALLLLVLAACGGTTSPAAGPEASHSVSPVALKAPGEAKVGDRTRCPVTGEEFVVSDESPHVEHGGKTYYFCCPHCVQTFEADPQKFVNEPAPASLRGATSS
jgi:YHS domain-containing protein